MIKLMYITNSAQIAQIVENAGVERVFVDMEYIGKDLRQGDMNTVQNHHTIQDIKAIRQAVSKAEVLVRCNPIHDKTDYYDSSQDEIDAIVNSGADIIMLPYFKTVAEVSTFIKIVAGRVRTMLLVETPEAVSVIDEILSLEGIDEVFVGLNDLSLGYGKKFMFELLADGTVDTLCEKFRKVNLPYGFGGIASIGKGMLPSELVIAEHYRVGSTCAILSRSFCNVDQIRDIDQVKDIFDTELKKIREYELNQINEGFDFEANRALVKQKVTQILKLD